jgi:hypothetical protein
MVIERVSGTVRGARSVDRSTVSWVPSVRVITPWTVVVLTVCGGLASGLGQQRDHDIFATGRPKPGMTRNLSATFQDHTQPNSGIRHLRPDIIFRLYVSNAGVDKWTR